MLTCPIYDVASLLPHSGKMVMLDHILHYDEQSISAKVYLKDNNLLAQDSGMIPAWMSLEILAQCIGAYSGCHAKNANEKIKLGFLLGSRKLNYTQDNLPLYQDLIADASLSLQDELGFAVFDCRLYQSHEPIPFSEKPKSLLVEAAINVFSPPDVNQFLQSLNP